MAARIRGGGDDPVMDAAARVCAPLYGNRSFQLLVRRGEGLLWVAFTRADDPRRPRLPDLGVSLAILGDGER